METFKKFIPAIIGVILLGAGVFFYFRSGELVKNCTERATATVVDMREDIDTSSSSEMRYLYFPIIEYETTERTVTKEIDSGYNTPVYRINEKIEILYNPNNVEEFIVAGENQNIVWMILGGLGIVFLGVGIFVIFKK